MKVKEILEDADLLVPNALSQTHKIRYLNQIQKQLYRDFPGPLKSEAFQTAPGTSMYNISMQTDRVKSVFVNDQEYTFKTTEDANVGYLYTFMDGELFIQPTPTEVLEGYVLYEGEPVGIVGLEEEISFLPDYHELFVLGLAQKLAMVVNDFKRAGEFEMRFRSLALEASIKLRKGKLRKIRTVRGWN